MLQRFRIFSIFSLILATVLVFSPSSAHANSSNVNAIIASMTTKEKIAQMIMPSFSSTTDIDALFSSYNFAGVILFAQNLQTTESATRLIDEIQNANKSNPRAVSQLLVATDQEGGYVTRLAYGTIMPGNMALGATNDPDYAYAAAKTIGQELSAVGINTDFAPVSDTNNNPANPIIGVRSFSDDPTMVGEFASSFMKGLKETNILTALKHFPGHGDTSTDTHSSMTVVDKSYSELKALELIPFQRLINEGTDLIMTAHIQYPQIEDTTYTSISDSSEIYLPATLSEKIITDILRTDMGYNGVVITDALNMGAISQHFSALDTAKLAIEAGVDILLMPVNTERSDALSNIENYIEQVATMVDNGEIDIDKVDAAVGRILALKENKGLLEDYNVNIEEKVSAANATVSTKANHDKEFEIAKKAITLVKNENNTLPLNANDKTLILYYYDSHLTAAQNALARLISDGIISSSENIEFMDYSVEAIEDVEAKIEEVDNVVIINSLYGLSNGAVNGAYHNMLIGYIEKSKEVGTNSVFVSTHLPYDIARFNDADAIIATYLANGVGFEELKNYTSNIPKYGPNVIAGFYQMFNENANLTGKLPVNIYSLNSDYSISNTVLYARGYGLGYIAGEESSDESSDNGTVGAPNSGSGPKALRETALASVSLDATFIALNLSILVAGVAFIATHRE